MFGMEFHQHLGTKDTQVQCFEIYIIPCQKDRQRITRGSIMNEKMCPKTRLKVCVDLSGISESFYFNRFVYIPMSNNHIL